MGEFHEGDVSSLDGGGSLAVTVDDSQDKIGTVTTNITREQKRGQRARRGQRATKATDQTGASKQSTPTKASELGNNPFAVSQLAWSIPFDLQRCIQMVSQLNGSDDVQRVAVLELEEAFASLAFDAKGCRVAQDVLELACPGAKVRFALKLRGHIMEAIHSPFANYVVQKTIEVLPAFNVQFVIDELAGSLVRVACHSYGVRVLCRLLEYCPPTMVEELVFKLTRNAVCLCRHKFGIHALHHILEYGTLEQSRAVMKELAGNVLKLAGQWQGSELILRALSNPELAQGSELLATLVENRALLESAPNRHNRRVLRALVQ